MALTVRPIDHARMPGRPLVHETGHAEGGRDCSEPRGLKPIARGGLSLALRALDLAEAPRRTGALCAWSPRIRAWAPLPVPAAAPDTPPVASAREVAFADLREGPPGHEESVQTACRYLFCQGPEAGEPAFGLMLSGCDASEVFPAPEPGNPLVHLGHLHLGEEAFATRVLSYPFSRGRRTPYAHRHDGRGAPFVRAPVEEAAGAHARAFRARSPMAARCFIVTPECLHVVMPLAHATLTQWAALAVRLEHTPQERGLWLEMVLEGCLESLRPLHEATPPEAHGNVTADGILLDLGFGSPHAEPSLTQGPRAAFGPMGLGDDLAWAAPSRFVGERPWAGGAPPAADGPADLREDDLFRLARVSVGVMGGAASALPNGGVPLSYPLPRGLRRTARQDRPHVQARARAHNERVGRACLLALDEALRSTFAAYQRPAHGAAGGLRARGALGLLGGLHGDGDGLAADPARFEREVAALQGSRVEGLVLQWLALPLTSPNGSPVASAGASLAALEAVTSAAEGRLWPPWGFWYGQAPEQVAFDLAALMRLALCHPLTQSVARPFFLPEYVRFVDENDIGVDDGTRGLLRGRQAIESWLYPYQPLVEPLRAMAGAEPAHGPLRRTRPPDWRTVQGAAPFAALPEPPVPAVPWAPWRQTRPFREWPSRSWRFD